MIWFSRVSHRQIKFSSSDTTRNQTPEARARFAICRQRALYEQRIADAPSRPLPFIVRLSSAKLAPTFGAVGLLLVCLDFTPFGPNAAGATLISRPLYGVFLAIALLALWIAPGPARDWKVKPSAWWWADIMVCTYVFVPIMQWTIPSPRPPGSPIETLLGLPLGGWPSGHMVSVFALAWVLMVARPQLAWPAFALAVAIGWARIESSAHYPFQVICGAAFGMALGWWTTRHREGLLLPRLYDGTKRKLAGPSQNTG